MIGEKVASLAKRLFVYIKLIKITGITKIIITTDDANILVRILRSVLVLLHHCFITLVSILYELQECFAVSLNLIRIYVWDLQQFALIWLD